MKNTLIIFDLDGTLIDSREDLRTGVNLMRAHYGMKPIDLETVSSYIGNGAKKLAERSLQGVDISVDEALEIMRSFYTRHMFEHTAPYPGVLKGLAILKEKNIKTAVVTNKPHESCVAILKHLKMDGFFNEILGASDEFKLKPAPDMLFEVMKRTSTDSLHSWMVGDNYTDMESGKVANVKTCFVTYGFGVLKDEDYDLSVDSLVDFANKAF